MAERKPMATADEELRIDRHDLDTEVAEQPRLYMKWSERYAEALGRQIAVKRNLQQVSDEFEMRVRKTPGAFGLDKPTEAGITLLVRANNEVRREQEAYDVASAEVMHAQNRKDSFEQRRSMLKILAELWLNNYYGDLNVKEGEIKTNRGRKE